MSAAMGAGAAAQFVGSIMQMIAAKQAQAAMSRAFEKELANQGRYQNAGYGEVSELVPQMGVEAARTQMAQDSQRREGFYDKNNQGNFSTGPRQTTARDQALYQMQGKTRAQLGSYGDWQLNSAIKRIRTQDKLNKISEFARTDAEVFPYKMQDAQHSADQLAAAGGLISSIGGGAANFGQLYGGPSGGGGVTGINWGASGFPEM